jgi:serine/threonine-protein kinase RsbW
VSVPKEAPVIPSRRSEQVLCQVPASSLYLAIIRCAVSAMATHLNMRLDDMEDLRRAVDEACIVLMRDAVEGSDLTCLLLQVDEDTVQVSVRAFLDGEPAIGPGTPSWWVLRRFGDSVETSTDDQGLVTICVSKRRSTAGV